MGRMKSSTVPRVGVVISQFDIPLGASFDLERLSRRIKSNKAVRDLVLLPYPSLKSQIASIANRFNRRRIERVIVVGCSERLYGKLFREAFGSIGIFPNFVEFVEITSTSGKKPDENLRAATRAIEMAIASVGAARLPRAVSSKVRPKVCVIGGGIAGISSALALARRGIAITLIERNAKLGGRLNDLNRIFPTYRPAAELLENQLKSLEEQRVEVRTGVEPISLKGSVGDYVLSLSDGSQVECGAIVVATGASLLVPTGLFGYGERSDVITQIELEAKLLRGQKPGSRIVMIQCVGSRNDERMYCSRICCTASIKNTIVIKEMFPDVDVTILSRGIAEYAADLDRARQMGVELIRYSPERPPKIDGNFVEVFDQISEMEAHIQFDTIVLAVPMIPSDSNIRLAKMLRIPVDQYGFLIEPNLRTRPEEFAPRGIFLAGTCHWPSTIGEAVVQGYGAAARAFDLIKLGTVSRQVDPAQIDQNLCRGCRRCYESCVHGAIEMRVANDGLPTAEVLEIQCVGCGVCVSICPSGAISLGDNHPRRLKEVLQALEVGK